MGQRASFGPVISGTRDLSGIILPPYFGHQRAEERGQLGRRPASRRPARSVRPSLHSCVPAASVPRQQPLSDELNLARSSRPSPCRPLRCCAR
eukprot:471550-Prymnesium_polylepis.1